MCIFAEADQKFNKKTLVSQRLRVVLSMLRAVATDPKAMAVMLKKVVIVLAQ